MSKLSKELDKELLEITSRFLIYLKKQDEELKKSKNFIERYTSVDGIELFKKDVLSGEYPKDIPEEAKELIEKYHKLYEAKRKGL